MCSETTWNLRQKEWKRRMNWHELNVSACCWCEEEILKRNLSSLAVLSRWRTLCRSTLSVMFWKKSRCRNSLYSKLLVLEKLLTGWKLCPIWGFWRGWYINIFVVWEPSCASIQNSFGLHHIYSLPQRTRNSVIRSHQNLLIIILRKVYSELFLCQVQTDQTDSVYVTGNSIAPTDVVTANLIRAHLQA